MTKKRKILLTVLIIVIFLIVCALVGAYLYYQYYVSIVDTEFIYDDADLSINPALSDKIVNIALFGIDGRDDVNVEGDRTDTIMIGTLDTKTHQVKVTSVMRDTFVKICSTENSTSNTPTYAGDQDGNIDIITDDDTTTVEEEGGQLTIDSENSLENASYNKINAAYAEGGAAATIKTLNENFDLNITDYVTVDFQCLMDIVDTLGGVEVNIPNEDVMYWTNQYLKESNGYGKREDQEITQTGVQTLTGAQALAFVRNRYSDSDYGRTQRQRELIQAVFNKAKNVNATTAIQMINNIYPYVKTSLTLTEIKDYAKVILNSSEETSFEQMRIPTDEFGLGGYSNEVFYLFPATLNDNVIALHKFLYGDEAYNPSYTVRQISQVIEDYYNTNAYNLVPTSETVQETQSTDDTSGSYESTSSYESSDSYSSSDSYDSSGSYDTYSYDNSESYDSYSYSGQESYDDSSGYDSYSYDSSGY